MLIGRRFFINLSSMKDGSEYVERFIGMEKNKGRRYQGFRTSLPALLCTAVSILGRYNRRKRNSRRNRSGIVLPPLERTGNNSNIQSVKAYLYKAVRNQSLHYCEHLRVREHYQHIMVERKDNHRNATPEDILELRELECIISEILNKLPERRRNIFGMHRFEGLKYKEIADKLSLSVKTVEAEMTKTYRLLRKEIEKYRLVL